MIHFNKSISVNDSTYNVNGEIFYSVDDFKATNASRTRERNDFDPSNAKDSGFTKVHSYEEAVDLLSNGYKAALDDFQGVINLQGNNKKKVTFKNDIVGFAPIVPNAIIGLPKSMINTNITRIKTPVIDIYYDSRFCSGESANTFIEVGKKLLSAIMTLEKCGYKINLYWCNFKTESYGENLDVCILKLKDSNRPLDINRITFPVAHPAMLRVFSFEWMSKVPDGTYRHGYGSGLINSYDSDWIKKFIPKLLGNNARYIHSENIKYSSIEDILEVIKNG